MNIGLIARQFDNREGFDLVDYVECGWPIFRITSEVVSLESRNLPAAEEFVLRSISIGESTHDAITDLLGLPSAAVQNTLDDLIAERLIDDEPIGNSSNSRETEAVAVRNKSFIVTSLGDAKLREGEKAHKEETVVFDFDGIRRKPLKLGDENVLRGKDLAERGAIQLRPIPAEAPIESEINLDDIARTVRLSRGRTYKRAILAIRRIIRREVLFRRCVGLLFRSRTTDEFHVGFAIDGKLAEDNESAFAQAGGAKRQGLYRLADESADEHRLRHYVGEEIWSSVADSNAVGTAKSELIIARRNHLGAIARTNRAKQLPNLREDELNNLRTAENMVRSAQASLDAFKVRKLFPYDQSSLLADAIRECKTRLFISTDEIHPSIVDAKFVDDVAEKCTKGATVHIRTILPISDKPKWEKGSFEPGVALRFTATQNAELNLGEHPPELMFTLIADNNFAVISNKPFLSERPLKPYFVGTVGLVIRDPKIVEKIARAKGIGQN